MGILRKTSSVLAGLMIAGGASATMISFNSIDDFGTVHYGGNIGGVDVDGLSASTSFELAAINDSSFVFDVTVANTSSLLWQSSRISAFGFNVSPDAASVEASESSPWFAVFDENLSFPNGFGSLEVCLKQSGGPENCQGGGGAGVEIGGSASFSLEMFFDNLPETVTLDNFGVRWQSLSSEALEYSGVSGTGTPVIKVPEPGALGLFGLGVVGLALARRRRLQKS